MMSNTAKKDELILEFNTKRPSKKIEKNNKNNYFYKVANHSELYKLGSSYLEDFKAGLKSFTISSTGYFNSQQKTILGLASYFDHYDDLKIAIISNNLFNGYFQEIIENSESREIELVGSDYNLNFFSFHHHFDFIDLNIILDIPNKRDDIDYEVRINDIISYYDIIFWDMPDLKLIQEDPEGYYPAIQSFDSLSIIASQSATKSEEIDQIKEFFESYNIGIKGLLFDPFQTVAKDEKIGKKKAWWKIFK
jgi:hypothetical protein